MKQQKRSMWFRERRQNLWIIDNNDLTHAIEDYDILT
jgi:hypothetical protein